MTKAKTEETVGVELALTQETIADASTREIREFAEAAAGLTFNEGADRNFMIAQIYEALEWDAYRPEDNATHAIITLNKTKDNVHPYQGGVNGNMFTIKRGVQTEVPIAFYNSMVESASHAYSLETIGKSGEISEGSPASRRLPVGALDIVVHGFVNKGSATGPQKAVAVSSEVTKTN